MKRLVGYYNYTVIATYASLVSGVFGIFLAFAQKPFYSVICLIISGILDMFDGKIARTKKRNKNEKLFGIQIDSLCDLVSFGILPTSIGYAIGLTHPAFILLFAMYALNAQIRLAYYNVEEMTEERGKGQKRTHYTGLPVTFSAFIFPAIYTFFSPFKPTVLKVVYGSFLLICGAMFILGIKIPKAGNKMIAVFALLGVIGVSCLVIFRIKGIIV